MVERTRYIDSLRVLAALAVVVIHVAAHSSTSPVTSTTWHIAMFYNGCSRWAVPVFVMISGAVFLKLKADIAIKDLICRYAYRLLRIFFLWSLFYIFISYTYRYIYIYIYEINSVTTFWENISGNYHLWFLTMLCGMYLSIPILKVIARDKQIIRYYLVLFILFSCFLKTFDTIFCENFLFTYINIDLHIVIGFSGYFLLGYYLHEVTLSQRIRKIIYVLSIFSCIITVEGTSYFSMIHSKTYGILLGNFTPNVLFMSIGIHTFVKYYLSAILEKIPFLQLLSKHSLGIYLLHPFFIAVISKIFHIETFLGNTLLCIPVTTALVFCFSLMASVVLKKTWLGKYLL